MTRITFLLVIIGFIAFCAFLIWVAQLFTGWFIGRFGDQSVLTFALLGLSVTLSAGSLIWLLVPKKHTDSPPGRQIQAADRQAP